MHNITEKGETNLPRKGDMTQLANKMIDQPSNSLTTPCSTEAVGSVENPEIENMNKRKTKVQEKLN